MMGNRARRLIASLAGLLLLPLSGATARAQVAPPQGSLPVEGQSTAMIRVVGESGEVLQENPEDLPLKPGQPFTFDAERESLRDLFRTGRYADITAEVADVGGSLRVDFAVRRNFYINNVTIEGL